MGQAKKERTRERQQQRQEKQKQQELEKQRLEQQDIDMIISQGDTTLTTEQATALYHQYEKDVVKALSHLWDPVKADETVPGVKMVDRENIPSDGTVLDETGRVVENPNLTTQTSSDTDTDTNTITTTTTTTPNVAEDIEDELSDIRRQKGVEKINQLREIADQKDTIFCQFQEDYKNKKNQAESQQSSGAGSV